jgi:hypothetical protein
MRVRSVLMALLAVLSIWTVKGQDKFHRFYPLINDGSVYGLNAMIYQTKTGHYATLDYLSKTLDMGGTEIDTVLLSLFKPKGDILVSRKFYIDDSYGQFLAVRPSIIENDLGDLYITLISSDESKPNKLIIKYNYIKDEGHLEVVSYTANEPDGIDDAHKAVRLGQSYFESYAGADPGEDQTLRLSKRGFDSTHVAFKYKVEDPITSPALWMTTSDLGIGKNRLFVTGNVDSINFDPYLLIMDTLGAPVSSYKYTDIQQNVAILLSDDVIITPDSGYVMSGLSVEVNIPTIDLNSYLIRTDKLGNVIWGKRLVFGNGRSSIIKSIVLDKNNDLIIAAANLDINTGEGNHVGVRMGLNGNIKFQKKFNAMAFPDSQGEIILSSLGGTILSATEIKDQIPNMSLIKLDDELATGCENEITNDIFFNNEYVADTLIWTRDSAVQFTKYDTLNFENNVFDIPVLSLEVRPFCPKEPINWLFKVPIKGATFYEWSTGDKGAALDSLRVFEEGKYSVTVTVGEDVCFMLCDTSTLAVYELPQVDIVTTLGEFCTTGKIRLVAAGSAEAGAKSFLWNNGETTAVIDIAGPGTYTVTFTDNCGEQAVKSIEIKDFPKNIEAVTITPQVKFDCNVGGYSGRLLTDVTPGTSQLGAYRYQWSTGPTDPFLQISQNNPVDVTVTVTDGCGKTATATFKSSPPGPGSPDFSVNIQGGNENICITGNDRLNAQTNPNGQFKYKWSTNAETPFIDITTPGSYTVSVTDLCSNTKTATRQIENQNKIDGAISINANNLCATGKLAITIVPNPDSPNLKFLWSTGETTRTIEPKTPGDYIVTITDLCDNKKEFKENISESELTPRNLEYAKVFFPNGLHNFDRDTTSADSILEVTHRLNRSFGPIKRADMCPDKITDYEFYVFNRWGQEVFESNDIDLEWSGKTDDGDEHPSETYVWVVRYKIFGFTKVLKGDINLIKIEQE